MKTVTIFSVLLFFSVLLAGCIQEEIAPNAGTGRVLTVNYSFDTPQTRATATGAEREVRDVAIFFYNADDTNPTNETYVDCVTTTVPSESGSTGSFPLPLPANIVQGNKYKLIIIGNYNRYAPEGKTAQQYGEAYNTRTYSKMKQEIQGQLASDDKRIVTPLPFWGRLIGADGNETTLTGPDPLSNGSLGVSVKFSRAVARFDLINLAADQLKIAWVKVCNYRNKGYFYNESLLPGKIIPGISATAPPGPPYPSGIVDAPEPSASVAGGRQQQKLDRGGLYAFPNTVSYTAQDDKLTTYLMIAGYFKGKGMADYSPKLTYYRANVSDNGSSQVLHRNYIYTLAINSVKKEGADTEGGASSEKEKLLDYVTDDSWENDDSTTATDGAGNFLTLSRTSIVLGSEKDESALIKVAVKEGTNWKVEWKDNPDEAFRYVKVNDNSFSILTNSDNPGDFTHNATLTVSVTGIATTVALTVNVIQLSSKNDPQMLLVEGKAGAFDYTVAGQGGDVSLQVITGSPTSKWKTTTDGNLDRMLTYHSADGVNKGFINLSFLANTGEARFGKLTVIRLLPDGTTPDPNVANVVITFNQDKSPYTVSLQPNYSKEGLRINGFLPDNTKYGANKICRYERFTVLLADRKNYTFEATCSFNQKSDAFITLNHEDVTRDAGPLQTKTKNPSTVTGKHGDNIYLHVFRTGPGDADITGDIVVKAVPNADTGLPPDTYTMAVTITSECKIGDSYVGSVLWADRNVGALSRGPHGAAVGLNYSNDPLNEDNGNTDFKGTYHTFAEAQKECSMFGATNHYDPPYNDNKWRTPTNAEQTNVAKRMLFSKQRGYIVSDKKNENGETVGCWFPISGYKGSETTKTGYFWSSTPNNYNGYYLYVYTGSANTGISYPQSYGYSVRCVR